VVSHDLRHQKGEKLLGEGGVEPSIIREVPKPFDLLGFSTWVRRWESVQRFELADLLRALEAFGQ
jgi:hypothetical protein